MKKLLAVAGVAWAGCFAGAAAHAAVNAYLTVPGLPGPSTSRPGSINILSFSWGTVSPTSKRVTGANCSDLTIMKVVDDTSPLLVANTLFGVDYPQVTLTYAKTVGTGQVDYFTIVANNASIANIQESGSSDNPTESVSIHATSYTVTYVPQLPTGAMGKPVTTTLACN